MKVTIVKDDGLVGVNGRFFQVDLSDLPENFHALQWDGQKGHVEYKDAPNQPLNDLSAYSTWIARWESAREAVDNPPPPTPEQVKAAAKAQIDRQRDTKFAAGFTFNGQLYHCDTVFQSQLQAFILAWQTGILPANATVSIRRKDNVTVQMTQAEVTALAAALMQYVQQVYAESWAAKDALG